MVYWNMLRKLRSHRALEAGEEPVAAVYGLGEAMLRMADSAADGLSGGSDRPSAFDGPDVYSNEFEAATEGRHRDGLASLIEGNGVLGLTERRLLWFKKATVVGRPGDPTAVIPIDAIVEAEQRGSMVRIVFADDSVAGLHVPRTQKPATFIEHLNRIAGSRN